MGTFGLWIRIFGLWAVPTRPGPTARIVNQPSVQAATFGLWLRLLVMSHAHQARPIGLDREPTLGASCDLRVMAPTFGL